MLVLIAQKTDVNDEYIEDLNEAYRYAIDYFEIDGITVEVIENTYVKQKGFF